LGDPNKGGRLRWFRQDVMKIPIRHINFSNPSDVTLHDRTLQLVEQMLDLHKHLHATKTEDNRVRYQRQIDATDREIDMLVYELYGLTDKEIRIVEGR
jgi:hypothetical protein